MPSTNQYTWFTPYVQHIIQWLSILRVIDHSSVYIVIANDIQKIICTKL